MHFRQRGFTLIELMVTVTILGIVLAIAVPNFTDWLNRKRVEGAANEFNALIQFARSESIKRNTKIYFLMSRTDDNTSSLMISNNPSSCTALNSCDLRNMVSTNYPRIQVPSIRSKLNESKISPVDLLLTFKDNTASTQSIQFQSANYQLQSNITTTGLTSICIPTGKPSIAGYSTCA